MGNIRAICLAASLLLGPYSASSSPMVAGPLASPNATKHRTTNVDGVDVFYRDAGPRHGPVMVLLHGLPSSSHMFRQLIPLLADRYRIIAPDYPGFGASEAPSLARYNYSFDRLAQTMTSLIEALGIQSYSLYLFDYGAPIGFRIATRYPEKVEALIVQNGNAYAEGMGKIWDPLRAYWKEPTAQRSKVIAEKLLSLESTKWHYLHGVRDPEAIAPENWLLDQALLDRDGLREIQLRLLYDYGSNPGRYAQWHAYFRKYQPPMLVVWGKNDPIFEIAGAYAYQRDLPKAEVHVFETGHFALEEDLLPIARTIRGFMERSVKAPKPHP